MLWLQLLRLLRLLLRWKSCDIALWNGCQIVLISIRLWLWGVTAKTSTRGSRLKRLWGLGLWFWLRLRLSKGVICAKLIEPGLLRLLETRRLWLLEAGLLRLKADLLRLLEAILLRLLETCLLSVKAGLLR